VELYRLSYDVLNRFVFMRHKESGRLPNPIHFSFSQDFLSEIKRLDTGYSSPYQPPHPLSYLGPGHHGHIFHDFRNFVSIHFSRRTFRNRNHVLTGNLPDDRFVHPGAFCPLLNSPVVLPIPLLSGVRSQSIMKWRRAGGASG